MSKQQVITSQYKTSVQELVWLADTNFQTCSSLYKKLNQQDRSNYNKFALLTANNAFDSTVIILRSLIESTDENELRFEPIIKSFTAHSYENDDCALSLKAKEYKEKMELDYPNPNCDYLISLQTSSQQAGEVMKELNAEIVKKCGRADFERLKKDFKDKGFVKIRHRVSAHKNKDVKYVSESDSMWLAPKHISDLGAILKDARLLSYFLCGWELVNRDAKEVTSSMPESLL
ncbi:MAG: hypothetical protein RLZZ234_511 [Candidatus Parcubacteria bacterium]|jgi:hypothetical protein